MWQISMRQEIEKHRVREQGFGRYTLFVFDERNRLFRADANRLQHAFASCFWRLFVENVKLVIVAHLENLGRDLHAAGVTLTTVVINYDFRKPGSGMDF
jgi:hypothetical protein